MRIALGDVLAVERDALAELECASRAIAAGSARCQQRASATARYIAPVSRYVKPSRAATARATVDLPAPAGPSMAMTMARRLGGRLF